MPSTHHTSNIFLAQGLDKENVVSVLYTYVLKTYKTYKSLYKTYKNHIKTHIKLITTYIKRHYLYAKYLLVYVHTHSTQHTRNTQYS